MPFKKEGGTPMKKMLLLDIIVIVLFLSLQGCYIGLDPYWDGGHGRGGGYDRFDHGHDRGCGHHR